MDGANIEKADQLRSLIRAAQFRPFWVQMSNGDMHDVVSRDHVGMTRDGLAAFVAKGDHSFVILSMDRDHVRAVGLIERG